MIAKTVFLCIGIVSVTWTEEVADVLVIARVLVVVAHLKTDRSTRGLAFKDTRENFYMILLLTTRSDGRLTGTTTSHLALQEGFIDLDTCWHAVDDTTDSGAMTLTESGQAEDITECIHVV